MNVKDFFNLFLIISAIHGLLFSSIILFSKERKEKSILFIILLIIAVSLNNFQSWVLIKGLIPLYLEFPWHFLIAPFFYLFLIHYIKNHKKYFNILKAVVPIFALIIVIRVFSFYLQIGLNNKGFLKYTIIEESLSLISSLSIFIYAYFVLKKHRKGKIYEKHVNFDNLNWINTFFKLGGLIYTLWLIPLIITLSFGFEINIYSYYPLRIFTTVLIYWLGYQSIIQFKMSYERKYLRDRLNITKPVTDLVSKHTNNRLIKELKLPKSTIDHVLSGLNNFEEHKEYTFQNVTLNSLAKKLNTNANYLSKIINHYKGLSFSNYINYLRVNNIVNELKENPKIRKFTIKAIAEEAGFNTSDSFSKVFYKIKGIKPSEYIKTLE